jgi:hypothetical protein
MTAVNHTYGDLCVDCLDYGRAKLVWNSATLLLSKLIDFLRLYQSGGKEGGRRTSVCLCEKDPITQLQEENYYQKQQSASQSRCIHNLTLKPDERLINESEQFNRYSNYRISKFYNFP